MITNVRGSVMKKKMEEERRETDERDKIIALLKRLEDVQRPIDCNRVVD